MLRLMTSLLAAGLLLPHAGTASAEEPLLRARPQATANSIVLKAGVSRLSPKAFAYRPGTASGASPLIVLLHPAGGNARDFLGDFTRTADRRGAILLALQASGPTWTLKPNSSGGANFGPDPAALDEALAGLFAKAAIDPSRVVILGFSDGASYALSVGLANPGLFRGVVALSPGTVWLPPKINALQRIFIAHGTKDDILPFVNVRDTIVPGLLRAGIKPRTLWFKGEHEIDDRSLEQALDFALGN